MRVTPCCNMPFVGVTDMPEHNFFHINRVLLLLFIVALQVGIRSFLPVSKRMEERMKDFPSLPQEASMKANW